MEITRPTRALTRFRGDPSDLESVYFRWLEPDPAEVTITDRAGLIVQRHLELGHVRRPGTALTRVYGASGNDGFGPAIQIVNDDMPLLVDSVTSALVQLGVTPTDIVHPIFDVVRDGRGRLVSIAPQSADGSQSVTNGSSEPLHESWIHIQLNSSIGDEVIVRIERELPSVLSAIRKVVDDTPEMLQVMTGLATRLDAIGHSVADTEITEYAALLRWLVDGNFTVLGYAQCHFRRPGSSTAPQELEVIEPRLGLLHDGRSEAHGYAVPRFDGPVFRMTNGSVEPLLPGSRDVYVIGVADFELSDSNSGNAAAASLLPFAGEHVFVGTFTVTGLHENVLDIPVISHRVRQVIDWAGYQLNSFSGQALLEILQSYPRAELFATNSRHLFEMVSVVTNLGLRRQVRLFMRRGADDSTIYCLVYLPQDRYSTEVRLRIQEILRAELCSERVAYSARVTDSDLAVAYFTVHRPTGADPVDTSDANRDRIQELIFAATRTWSDRFLAAATAAAVPTDVSQDYATAFPGTYQQEHDPGQAVDDLLRVADLADGAVEASLYRPVGAAPEEWRCTLYVCGAGVSLSTVLPMLHSLGFEVVDERPYPITPRNRSRRWIYNFALRVTSALVETNPQRVDDPTHSEPNIAACIPKYASEAFSAMWQGHAEVDSLNELVVRAGLDWRQISALRAYAKYLQQIRFAYTFGNIARVLLTYHYLARLLTELFEARFDPDAGALPGSDPGESLTNRLKDEIDEVIGLDADRILRAIVGLINATLRTNYYRRDDTGHPLRYLSFKLDSAAIENLPKPRPKFEIFVYSPRVEGVHLRFGHVARGGLRWSDRLEDFRTEILGLVKAQAVKNAVIVPVGAKGGFVVKQQPPALGDTAAHRRAVSAEAIECYRIFISGLLDITDNVDHTTGRVLPPDRVIRHDGDDTYLVVAADKGTATFSDIANEVAGRYGFWLGDAFASGGSAGYDHKAMGITAKGAWESVKRHFQEMGLDTQAQDFTVIGIGDMSGDVFGNGMLLSEHIRLVAAFDHRHIFLDPDPDTTTSYKERRRIFELPRSSWADYNDALISEGGGVYARSAKTIPVTSQVRSALGLSAQVTSLSPPDMIKAILQAPVDLLWNGGIGTYVKATKESHADVGDKSNDSVRVDACRVRAKVIGEGGNLGISALGRIEFCTHGGKCNTDALDNSAGVDCSDHEVNIKVLLDTLISNGQLAMDERGELLSSMTDEVAELVLSGNVSQNVLMGLARTQAPSMIRVHQRLIAEFESRRGLDRYLEALPSDSELDERAVAGDGLTSPELANLMAHVKLSLKAELLAGELLDTAALIDKLPGYFPTQLRDRFDAAIKRHPLRREIVATMVVNDMVDNGGITFAFRLAEEAGATSEDAVRAFTIAAEIFDMHALWERIRATSMPTAARDELELETKRLLDRAARWLLTNRPQPLAIAADIARYRAGVRALTPTVPNWRPTRMREMIRRSQHALDLGAPTELAEEVFLLIHRFPLLDVLDVADLAERDTHEVAALYYALDDHLEIQRLLTEVGHLDRGNRWRTLARLAIREDLYSSLRALTLDVLRMSDPTDGAEEKIAYWESTNQARLSRARAALQEIIAAGVHDLATLSVAARGVRAMISGGDPLAAKAGSHSRVS